MISVNWNLDNIFLFFAQFVCSLIGRAQQRIRCGWKVTKSPLWLGLSFSERLRTLFYPGWRPEMHTNTHTRRGAILHWPEAQIREDYWTHYLPSEFTINSDFSSPSPFLSPSCSPNSLPHLLSSSQQRSVACQDCELLAPPFLVAKQVILFSIPVSTEMVIICPLKRSHTLSGAMLEKPAREIVEADLAEKITSDLLQQTQNQQQQQELISHSCCFFRNYRSIIYRGELVWIYIYIYTYC